MIEENYGLVCEIDHCFRFSKINLANQNETKKSTSWIKLGPMYYSENTPKGSKIEHRLYLMQEIKSQYFLKLNEEGPNQIIH